MSEHFVRQARGPSVLLMKEKCQEDVRWDAFDPETWGDAAIPVSNGGRGSAWFIERPAQQDWVLRHYLRGGLVARISHDLFLFLGEERVRSFQELRLLDFLLEQGLPVPTPVAARYDRAGGGLYRASILIERIPGARTLLSAAQSRGSELPDSETLAETGRQIRRFHLTGLDHVDLNLNNILLAPAGIYLVDFDKCRLHSAQQSRAKWQDSNLARLHRSLHKELQDWPEAVLQQLWRDLLTGYESQGNTL
ncbi:3-deoxy-D-manno-octulosonic acid kinase [Marinobacter sp.]|uniref:3-deoxy-D-manno-octulosonic acid kinase n=1 Tax=Marinobacter sp. TaxID=50741 RepID=UPI00384BB7DE